MTDLESDPDLPSLVAAGLDRHNMRLQAIWASRDHTGTVVPVLAVGPGSERFGGSRTNWQLGRLLAEMLRRP